MATLDRSAAMVLDMIRLSGAPATNTLTPEQARTAYRAARAALSPEPPPLTDIRDLAAPGRNGAIPLRRYRDGANPAPRAGMVYYHGGGWVIGDLDTHDVVCRQIAQRTGAIVVAVDYRMGPEHKFPAAVEDAIDATAWIAANAADLGIDPHRLAIAGDSAGGNLAAVVAIDARDNHGPALALQALIYPSIAMSMTSPSQVEFAEGYGLTHETMIYFRTHYLRGPDDMQDWRAAPIRAAHHENLPPALIITAGFDPLRDEGEDYATTLVKSGVPVTLRRFPGQIHGFITMGRVIPEATEAINEIANAMAARGL
ncbi:alpha/beta hydrolase [Acidiphilium sp.]|uniref:alpha/beta hydrolase n=1 Tax=Acidiphilium sp. TaxID=527 RepID=UPI003D080607